MWAIDTNLLVRYYTQDDAKQTKRALTWLQEHAPCFVPVSVVQELYWVLENAYAMPTKQVLVVLQHLAGSPAFQLESAPAIQQALQVAEQGLEFPDALHWALSSHCQGLATFDDKGFAKRAQKMGLVPVVSVPG